MLRNITARELYVTGANNAIVVVGGGTAWINIDDIKAFGAVEGAVPTLWVKNAAAIVHLNTKRIYSSLAPGGTGLANSEISITAGIINIYGLKIPQSLRRYSPMAIVNVGSGAIANLYDCFLKTYFQNALRTAGITKVYNSYLEASAETSTSGVVIKSGGTLDFYNSKLFSSDPAGWCIYAADAQAVNAFGLNYNIPPHANVTITNVGRVVDARIDDTINESAWDATTAGVLDAIRDAMIAKGFIAPT